MVTVFNCLCLNTAVLEALKDLYAASESGSDISYLSFSAVRLNLAQILSLNFLRFSHQFYWAFPVLNHKFRLFQISLMTSNPPVVLFC